MLFLLKYLKYLKLCIVSPTYEIIVELIMIAMFLATAFLIQNQGKQLYNYQLAEIISDTFKESQFTSINSINSYMNYLDKLVDTLYEYNPSNNGKAIPYYIPYGAIRLNVIYNEKCSKVYDEIENNMKCTDEQCTIDLLTDFYKNPACMYSFNGKRDKLLRKYEGIYRNYFFQEEGTNIDFTIDDYYGTDNTKNRAYIYDLLQNKDDIKFLALLFNVYFPYDNAYGCSIAAIEMINSHINLNERNFIFNSSIIAQINNDYDVLFAIFLVYSIGTVLGFIKVVYEMNVKLVFSIHIFELLDYVINILLLIFFYIYLTVVIEMPLAAENGEVINIKNINLTVYHNFYKLLSLQFYIFILISLEFLFLPVKILSLLSWCSFLSKPFVQFASIIFRILPGILVHLCIMLAFILPTVIINYTFYRTKMVEYQFLFASFLQFLNIFEDVSDIKLMDESSNGYSIKYSISQTEYALCFNIAEKIGFTYSFVCLISYCINAIEKAFQYESKKEDDEILKKMEDVGQLLEKEEENNDDSLGNLKKQILWINFENNNNLYNKILNKIKDMLLFKNSNQVISFLKYLFALKPLMQFKNLKTKLCIVIQYPSFSKENKHIKDKIIDNIRSLLEWLNFVGCKIPVIIHLEKDFSSLQKIQVSTSYKLIYFTDNLNIIDNFIKDEDDDDSVIKNTNELKIVNISKFTLYKINFIIVKEDNTKINNKKLNLSRENSNENKNSLDDNNDSELNFSYDGENKDEKNNKKVAKNVKVINSNEDNQSSYFSKDSFSDSPPSKSN